MNINKFTDLIDEEYRKAQRKKCISEAELRTTLGYQQGLKKARELIVDYHKSRLGQLKEVMRDGEKVPN